MVGSSLEFKLFLAYGETEEQISSWTDSDPHAIEWMKIYRQDNLKGNFQFRNIRNADGTTQNCINNVGSFQCLDLDEERIAIGWGGHTDDGGARPSGFSVIMPEDGGRVCVDHKIPALGGRYSPVIGVIGNWLWACGGEYSNDCKKLDMNSANPSWVQAVNYPLSFIHSVMYTYGDYLYILGGYNGNCYWEHYRITSTGGSWESRQIYPRPIHRHTAVVDNVLGRIWVLGGHECGVGDRAEVYYYTPSSNAWTHHSNMPYARLDVASTIITQKNGERWLMILRSDYEHVHYYNLDTNSGWHHVSSLAWKFGSNMQMLSLTPNSAFMMGAYSNHYGYSLRNFWVYNSENYRFEHIKRFVYNEHGWGYWTLSRKDFKVFDNCRAERTYVAVGYGGNDWVWS